MSLADLTGIKVEIGFGVDAIGGNFFVLDDPVKGELDGAVYVLAPDTVFIDVTDHVSALTIKRGRDRELDEYATGVATIVFNDDDRTFDPAYTASPYYGQITPMRRARISWNDDNLFTGWVDDWTVVYEPGDSLSRVTADCVDGFAVLANQELDEIAPAHSGDLAGQRIDRVLDRNEVNYPPTRDIDAGNTTLGATTLGENALAYLQSCARAEAGYLFISAGGTLTFRDRLSVLNTPAGFVFSDDRTAGIPYRTIAQRSAADLLYTRVTGESETVGAPLEAVDEAAAEEFLIRTLPLGTLLTIDNAETQNLLDFHLSRFSAPELRFNAATLAMETLASDEVAAVTSLDLTDIVTVERSPLNVGAAIERLSIVDGISHSIVGNGSRWTVDLAFANADTRSFLKLDDPVFGVLDANRLAF